MKISEKLSAYSKYECFHLKVYKIQNPRPMPQETQQNTFKFDKSPRRENNFKAPL